MLIIADNKPVYDRCQGERVTIKDKRTAIDMIVIKADLRAQNASLRWVDARQMEADALTKLGAIPDFLYFVLKHGKYIVIREGASLLLKVQEKMLKRNVTSPYSKGCEKSPTLHGEVPS